MERFSAFGQCKPNKGNKILDLQGYGPMVVAAQQWDDVDFLLGFLTQDSTYHHFTTLFPSYIAGVAQETAQTGASGHVGNGVLLDFTHVVGAAGDLGNTYAAPVVPGTLLVHPTVMGTSFDGRDINADGLIYSLTTGELMGTIDYQYGYLDLAYPTGHAPGAGAINVTFYSGTWLTTYGNRLIEFAGAAVRDQLIRVVGLTKLSDHKACRVRLDAVFGW